MALYSVTPHDRAYSIRVVRYRLDEIDRGFDDLRAARNVRGLIVYDT